MKNIHELNLIIKQLLDMFYPSPNMTSYMTPQVILVKAISDSKRSTNYSKTLCRLEFGSH